VRLLLVLIIIIVTDDVVYDGRQILNVFQECCYPDFHDVDDAVISVNTSWSASSVCSEFLVS
jgi:hypothetical protein